jgi:hypothetical protein
VATTVPSALTEATVSSPANASTAAPFALLVQLPLVDPRHAADPVQIHLVAALVRVRDQPRAEQVHVDSARHGRRDRQCGPHGGRDDVDPGGDRIGGAGESKGPAV